MMQSTDGIELKVGQVWKSEHGRWNRTILWVGYECTLVRCESAMEKCKLGPFIELYGAEMAEHRKSPFRGTLVHVQNKLGKVK